MAATVVRTLLIGFLHVRAVDQLLSQCCNGPVRFEVDTRVSPKKVRRALTDFPGRRLQT
jgi:hypothetical protein